MYVYVYACVLDTCELISNDSVDYGLADYGLHGFENLSRTKDFFCVSILRSVYILDTCELISNDYADCGLADYGLHGFETLSSIYFFA